MARFINVSYRRIHYSPGNRADKRARFRPCPEYYHVGIVGRRRGDLVRALRLPEVLPRSGKGSRLRPNWGELLRQCRRHRCAGKRVP